MGFFNAPGLLALLLCLAPAPAAGGALTGIVLDSTDSPIPGASVSIYTLSWTELCRAASDDHGRFDFPGLPAGSYALRAEAPGFQARTLAVRVNTEAAPPLPVRLDIAPLYTEISVTVSRAAAVNETDTPHLAIVNGRDDAAMPPAGDSGAFLQRSPGLLVQHTTPGQLSPFLRGMTGYQTLLLIDGVRFNTSLFRSGPNQYFALIDPSQVEAVECSLGPSGSIYGSDSMGGTLAVRTRQPPERSAPGNSVRGESSVFGSTGDISGGANAQVSLARDRAYWLGGAAGARHNDARAGRGYDSHNVFRRYFDLEPRQIRSLLGSRLQDTAFGRRALYSRLSLKAAADQNLTLWFQRTALTGIRSYRETLGGLGRLLAEYEPQWLTFAYARYEKLRLGPLDSLSGTFSVNMQRDDMARQGTLRGDPTTFDNNRVDVFGYAVQASTRFHGQSAVFGTEVHQERIASLRTESNPVVRAAVRKRALYPDRSRYLTAALFAEDSAGWLGNLLRANVGGRLTLVRFHSPSDPALGVTESGRRFRDMSFHANLSLQATERLGLSFLVRRGFRAPNLNDLGAVGLTGLGFEVPSEHAIPAGALVSTDAGEAALSRNRPLESLRPEELQSYEFGLRINSGRLYARVHAFDSQLTTPIVRRTLLFPEQGVPALLGGIVVTPVPQTDAQKQQGVAAVRTEFDSRSVKAFVNDGRQRYYGTEALFSYEASSRWSLRGNYSFIAAREVDVNRAVRRLPPQQGSLGLRFSPLSRLWLEVAASAAGAQERVSPDDVDDERIGASRSRRDIVKFFQSAIVAPWISAGQDGKQGTADDTFVATGETAAQIRDRVLPLGSIVNNVLLGNDNTRVPLYVRTPGWFRVDLTGGFDVTESSRLNFALGNVTDANYRVHGSGTDSPGVYLTLGLRLRF